VLDPRRSDLEYRLKARHDSLNGWHPAPALNGWTPDTTEQLATVEELADRHDGVAFVRNDGGRTAEVLVTLKRRHCQHWVDKSGNTGLVSETPAGLHSLSWAARAQTEHGTWIQIRTEPRPSD
jgi:hypothetical protein